MNLISIRGAYLFPDFQWFYLFLRLNKQCSRSYLPFAYHLKRLEEYLTATYQYRFWMLSHIY